MNCLREPDLTKSNYPASILQAFYACLRNRCIFVNNTLVFSRETIKIQQVHCRLLVKMPLFRFAKV